MSKTHFAPPTEDDVTNRKMIGGGETKVPPGNSGRGWFGDYEGHADAARKGWNKRRESDKVPDSNKEFVTRYPKATNEPGWISDAEKLKKVNKVEEKHEKEDEKIRQRGMKESVKVEQEKVELERKVKEYESKHDDKLRKQIQKEQDVLKERQNAEKGFDRETEEARKVLEKYDKRERELDDEEKRQIREKTQKELSASLKDNEKKESLLVNKLQTSAVNLSKLKQQKQNNDVYFKREMKNYDDITSDDNADLMKQAKERLKSKYERDNAELVNNIKQEEDLNKQLKSELESARNHEQAIKKELGTSGRDFDIQKLRNRSNNIENTQRSVEIEKKRESKGSFDINKIRERHSQASSKQPEKKEPIGTPKGLSADYHQSYYGSKKQGHGEKVGSKGNEERNKKLINEYRRRYPRRSFRIPKETWDDIEYTDYQVLEGYLDAVASGDKQDIQQEYEVMEYNTKFNKKQTKK